MGCSSSRSLSNTSSPVTSSSSSHQCIPHPVFVIKTMNDSSDEKLFINVLILKDTSEIAASEVMISDPVTDVDRRSHRCHIVDFVCSPLIVEYPGNGNSSEFNPQFSKFCLWCIELTRDTLINRGVLGNMDTLSTKYSNPKVINNYKGKSIGMYDKSKVVTGVNFDGEAPNSKHHSEALEELRDEAIARRQSLEEAERRKQAIIASSTKVLSKDNDQRSVRSMDVENVHKAEGDLMAIKQDSIHLDLSDEEHDEAEPELELPSSMSTDAEATEIKTKGLPLSNAANFRYSDQSDGNGRVSIQNKILQQGSEKFFSKNLGISASIFNKAKPSTTEAPKEKTNSGIDTKDSFWTNRSSSSESDMVKNVSVQGTVLREESEKLKGNATSSGGSNQSDMSNTKMISHNAPHVEDKNSGEFSAAFINTDPSEMSSTVITPALQAKAKPRYDVVENEENGNYDVATDTQDETENTSQPVSQNEKIQTFRTEGYATKESRGTFLKNWKHRYFVLSSEKLEYFIDQSRLDKKGEFFIDENTTVQHVEESSTMFVISSPSSGMMKVNTPSNKERDEWMETIKFHISSLSKQMQA